MAGDEEKKKKKKTKKVAAEEAAAPPPEPEPVPEPAPVEEAAPVEAEAAAAEEGAPAGEEGAVVEEGELPPQPKKKPKFFVHWDRRKARFYDYNFDYGSNYYQSMVGYVDQKNQGSTCVPRRMAFAERGMYSSLSRSRNPDMKTQSLLNDVRNSIRNFENCQKVYAYGSGRRK